MLEGFLRFFFSICSWPRLILEVFIRRDMGERYFSFSMVISALLTFLCIPLLFVATSALNDSMMSPYGGYGHRSHDNHYGTYIGIIAFAAAFFYAGLQRRKEIARLPSVFDFARFSLSTGYSIVPNLPLPFMDWLAANPRREATVLEPGLCFLVGLVIVLINIPVGILLMFCSVVYSLSYVAAYKLGDFMIMDQIDNIICSEEFDAAFNEDRPQSETRGFQTFGRRPADPKMRRKVADSFFPDEEETVEAR